MRFVCGFDNRFQRLDDFRKECAAGMAAALPVGHEIGGRCVDEDFGFAGRGFPVRLMR
jgi:hypothetical protein